MPIKPRLYGDRIGSKRGKEAQLISGCPTCGGLIDREKHESGGPVIMVCYQCGDRWEAATGMPAGVLHGHKGHLSW